MISDDRLVLEDRAAHVALQQMREISAETHVPGIVEAERAAQVVDRFGDASWPSSTDAGSPGTSSSRPKVTTTMPIAIGISSSSRRTI